MIELKGITWDHARGFDPVVATANAYMQTHPDIKITWQKRSLKEFGDFPIEKLAETFDLLIIDHPFVGFAADDGCLIPLEEHVSADFLAEQAANSIGKSHISYNYGGHQWALAIDAAAQISAYRADLIHELPTSWDDVLTLAKKLKASGKSWVALPIVPIDSLMCLFSIAASTGEDPCDPAKDIFVSREVGRYALDMLIELAAVCHPQSMEWNPIKAFDAISTTDEVAYIPLLFGYSNYGRSGFREKLVSFTNVPKTGDLSSGAILGGTGFAVSTRCQHIMEACDYAQFTASPDIQRGLYFENGGQPGHRSAWLDDSVNAASNNFFKNTLETLDNSYLRPRYNGYLHFQEESWYAVHDFLREGGSPDIFLDSLDAMYRKSLKR